MGQTIRLLIIAERKRFLDSHEVNGVGSHEQEYYLHEEEIHSFPASQQVNVTGQKHDQKYLLSSV